MAAQSGRLQTVAISEGQLVFFEAYRDYARKIIAEVVQGPAHNGLSYIGPFRSDHLGTYKGKKLVEFTTPGHKKGLGTMSWLLPSDQPITGFALLADTV